MTSDRSPGVAADEDPEADAPNEVNEGNQAGNVSQAEPAAGAEREPRTVDDIHALLDSLELTGVKYLEISGRRQYDRPADFESTNEFGLQARLTTNRFQQRFKFELSTQKADFVTEVQTSYTMSDGPIAFEQELGDEFVERVAVMAAYPFLREGIASTAARLEVDVPMLGMLRAGQFSINVIAERTAEGTAEGPHEGASGNQS